VQTSDFAVSWIVTIRASRASGGASMGAIWPCRLISKRTQSNRALGWFLPSEGDLKRAS